MRHAFLLVAIVGCGAANIPGEVGAPTSGGPGLREGNESTGSTPAAHADQSARIDPVEVQRIVRADFDQMRACYDAGRGRDPNLGGRIETRFVIGPDGRVLSAERTSRPDDLPDNEVAECVLARFRGLRFPKPSGRSVTVTFPIVFAPDERLRP